MPKLLPIMSVIAASDQLLLFSWLLINVLFGLISSGVATLGPTGAPSASVAPPSVSQLIT